jgi:hypothetical protein
MTDIDQQRQALDSNEAVAMAAIVAWSVDCPKWQRDVLRRLYVKDKLDVVVFDELLVLCKDDSPA